MESAIPMTRRIALPLAKFKSRDRLLFNFCVMFAFLISFEHVFDLYAGLDTVLKPYRIVGIFIIVFGNLIPSSKWYNNNYDKYWIYYLSYSVGYTVLIFAVTSVNFAGLINDALQIAFNVMIYLSLKKCNIDRKRMNIILKSYILGVLLNTLFVFFQYFLMRSGSRPSGFSDNSNAASFSMAMAAILFIYYLFDRKGSKVNYFGNNALLSFAFPISAIIFLLLGMAIVGSRGGFLTLGVGALYIISRQSVAKLAFAIFTLLVLVGIFTARQKDSVFNLLGDNAALNRFERSTEDIRVVLWKAGLNAITDSYFMGIGMAQYRSNTEKFVKYTKPVSSELVSERLRDGKAGLGLHNLFVEVAVECGIIGLILVIVFFYKLFRVNLARSRFFKDYTPYLALAIGVVFFSFTGRNLLTGFFWFSIYLCTLPYAQVMSIFQKREMRRI